MFSALVVSAAAKFLDAVSELLPDGLFGPVDVAGSPREARAILRERAYDTMFINSDRSDTDAVRLAEEASDAGTVVLLLLPEEDHAKLKEKLRERGVLTLKKPISLRAVADTAENMCAVSKRLGIERRGTERAEEKLGDISIINRAKWMLIDNLKMTEADAHRYIERQAMDRSVTKRQVAENILKTYKTV